MHIFFLMLSKLIDKIEFNGIHTKNMWGLKQSLTHSQHTSKRHILRSNIPRELPRLVLLSIGTSCIHFKTLISTNSSCSWPFYPKFLQGQSIWSNPRLSVLIKSTMMIFYRSTVLGFEPIQSFIYQPTTPFFWLTTHGVKLFILPKVPLFN